MSDKEKDKAKRVDYNPWQELVGMVDGQGMMQFRIHLSIQDPNTKQWKTTKFYPGMSPEDVSRLEEIVQAEFGGGVFVASIGNAADVKERYYNYQFAIAGPPKSQMAAPVWDPLSQQFVAAPAVPVGPQGGGIQINPQVAGHPFYGGGYGGYPQMPAYPPPPPWWAMQQMMTQQQQAPRGPSPEEALLREQNKALAQQAEGFERKLDEEKHQRELDRRESDMNRKLDEMKAAHERAMAEIKAVIAGNGSKDQNTVLETMLKLNQGTQDAIVQMKKGEVDSAKSNLDTLRMQMEKDYEYRRDMFKLIQEAQDPSKHAELINRFGEFAASNVSLIMQLVSSGVLDRGGAEDPPWKEPLREAISSLTDFGKQMFESKAPPRGPVQLGQRLVPPNRPALGAGAPPGAPQGLGGQPKPPAAPGAPAAPAAPVKGKLPIPPAMREIIVDIGKALLAGEEAGIVGEMIWNLCDGQRFFGKLPPEWMPVFTSPKEIVITLLAQHGVPPQLDNPEAQAYLDAIAEVVLTMEHDFQEDMKAKREAIAQEEAEAKAAEAAASEAQAGVVASASPPPAEEPKPEKPKKDKAK